MNASRAAANFSEMHQDEQIDALQTAMNDMKTPNRGQNNRRNRKGRAAKDQRENNWEP